MDVNEAIRKEAAIRRYSERTIETYQNCVNRFFQYCGKEAREVTKKDIREFLENLSEKSAGATIHVYVKNSGLKPQSVFEFLSTIKNAFVFCELK